MADYTPEQVEKLARFARAIVTSEHHWPLTCAKVHGILTPDGTLADWLRKEDWADRAARDAWDIVGKNLGRSAECKAIADIIRKHAEGRP